MGAESYRCNFDGCSSIRTSSLLEPQPAKVDLWKTALTATASLAMMKSPTRYANAAIPEYVAWRDSAFQMEPRRKGG